MIENAEWKQYGSQIAALEDGAELAVIPPVGRTLMHAARGVRSASQRAGVKIHVRADKEHRVIYVRKANQKGTNENEGRQISGGSRANSGIPQPAIGGGEDHRGSVDRLTHLLHLAGHDREGPMG